MKEMSSIPVDERIAMARNFLEYLENQGFVGWESAAVAIEAIQTDFKLTALDAVQLIEEVCITIADDPEVSYGKRERERREEANRGRRNS